MDDIVLLVLETGTKTSESSKSERATKAEKSFLKKS